MKDITWDAYQIFLAVARHGGLTGAAQASGLSPATVGRRVLDLEQGIGRQLFLRSQTGYRLTADGQALFEQLQAMDAVVRKVDVWRQEAHGSSVVRLMAGTWGTWLICENIQAIRSDRDGFRLDMSVSERRATLAHREHDIGIRAVVPDEPHLARRHAGEVAYAAYRQRNAPDGLAASWLAVSDEDAISPYLRWPHENTGASIAVIVSRPRSLLDLARAGAGQAVLPCFVGDLDPGLERVGDELKTLRHAQWIITNSEDRHRRDIHTVSERLFRLLKSHSDLIAGKRPSRTV
ncbi:LysR family transcriptional regulator [Rhizobium herbae]|uniref:DNA-binding transcriptional LysR family regulator n=1 Tax=Rhizobium herbae TaxID=508661 RepID=A0ABS4EVC8_9HYPH|nr:LysR family transcriptional regulator [Rhizobium herbae]MBP1861915.1 DNA-binding transcriptional LysR family regulator [Rhizobium herbae]